MKYQQSEFSEELLEKIKNTEVVIKDHIDCLLLEYKTVFADKKLDFDAGFDSEGNDPFMPRYSSSVSIGITEENEERIDLHIINIWECERYFLGMPISVKIPGSKIVGELLDETFEELKEELKQYIDDLLEE
jgi:hypothetical protein